MIRVQKNILSSTYANGLTKKYIYDKNDRLISVNENGVKVLENKYNTMEEIFEITDLKQNKKTFKTFDFVGRIGKVEDSYGNSWKYEYGTNNNIIQILSNQFNKTDVLDYTYDKDNRVTRTKLYELEGLKTIFDEAVEYDSIGRIKANQIKKDENRISQEKIEYSYDTGGNIINKRIKKGDSEESISYVYDNEWKDQLIAYNNMPVHYDEIGNPTLMDGATLAWKSGRNLSEYKKEDVHANYKYDKDNFRFQKNVNGIMTNYLVSGDGNVLAQKTDDMIDSFDRGKTGQLVSMRIGDEIYYYKLNIFSDVEGLLDKDGNEVVTYKYDSWGKMKSVEGELKDTIGSINPFRYHSYYYDNETENYYLQSRYYNPEIGRFINMDDRLVDNANVFSYCDNNPIIFGDEKGTLKHAMCGWALAENEKEIAIEKAQWGQYIGYQAYVKYGAKLYNMYNDDYNRYYGNVRTVNNTNYTGTYSSRNTTFIPRDKVADYILAMPTKEIQFSDEPMENFQMATGAGAAFAALKKVFSFGSAGSVTLLLGHKNADLAQQKKDWYTMSRGREGIVIYEDFSTMRDYPKAKPY